MNLTVAHAGTCTDDGALSFSWSIEDAAGTRLAEQCGTVAGYPARDCRPLTAELEALLAALEWLQPFQLARVETLHVTPSEAARRELMRPDEDGLTAAARCAAYLALFRRRGVGVTMGPPPPQPTRADGRERPGRAAGRSRRRDTPAHGKAYH